MKIQSNIREQLIKQEKRIKALKSNPIKVTHKVASLIRDRAKAYAPKKSGTLASGVVSRNLKNCATVYAFDPKKRVNGNMLALWADRRTVFEYTNSKQKYWLPGQVILYGGPGLLLSGKTPQWTGQVHGDAGYFTLAVRYGRKHFKNEMAKAIKASMAGIKI